MEHQPPTSRTTTKNTSSAASNLTFPKEGSLLLEDVYTPGEVYLLNQPIQCLLIITIILMAVMANSLVIHNICRSQLKLRSVNFLLIKNLCIVDLVGAAVVLPVPLAATIKGEWDFGDAMCTVNSIVNVALWLQHIVMFAMLKIDRVLASCLPFGKYPLLPVEVVLGVVLAAWVIAFFVAALVTVTFSSSYEPAVVLCIPELPIGFFITIFTVYCLVLFAMVTGYIGVLVCLKKKQSQIQNTNTVQATDYKGLERAALMSFLITISHFLLYVPTMLVIGLHGWFLHPIAILFCDMIVYSEFLIHPVVLLSTSTKLRQEIKYTIKTTIHDTMSLFGACIKEALCVMNKSSRDQIYAVPSSRSPDRGRKIEHINNHSLSDNCNIIQIQQQHNKEPSLSPVRTVCNTNVRLVGSNLIVTTTEPVNDEKPATIAQGELTSVVVHETIGNYEDSSDNDDSDVIMEIQDDDGMGDESLDEDNQIEVSRTVTKTGGRSLSREVPPDHYVSANCSSKGSPLGNGKSNNHVGARSSSANLETRRSLPKKSQIALKRHSLHGAPDDSPISNKVIGVELSTIVSSSSVNSELNPDHLMPTRLANDHNSNENPEVSHEIIYKAPVSKTFLKRPALYMLPTEAFIARTTPKHWKAGTKQNDEMECVEVLVEQNHDSQADENGLIVQQLNSLREIDIDDIVI